VSSSKSNLIVTFSLSGGGWSRIVHLMDLVNPRHAFLEVIHGFGHIRA
jgi:hypothetical protein